MKSSGTHDNDQDQWEYQLDKLNVDLNNMILSLAMAAFFTWNVIIHMNTTVLQDEKCSQTHNLAIAVIF